MHPDASERIQTGLIKSNNFVRQREVIQKVAKQIGNKNFEKSPFDTLHAMRLNTCSALRLYELFGRIDVCAAVPLVITRVTQYLLCLASSGAFRQI